MRNNFFFLAVEFFLAVVSVLGYITDTFRLKGLSMEKWTPSTMGRKGGRKSRRVLTSDQARAMTAIRELKRAGIIRTKKRCPLEIGMSAAKQGEKKR